MKLNFNIKLEAPEQPELNLSVDIPDKYATIGLESAKLVAAIKQAVDKIREALNEENRDGSS
jgi:hypothetical protein